MLRFGLAIHVWVMHFHEVKPVTSCICGPAEIRCARAMLPALGCPAVLSALGALFNNPVRQERNPARH